MQKSYQTADSVEAGNSKDDSSVVVEQGNSEGQNKRSLRYALIVVISLVFVLAVSMSTPSLKSASSNSLLYTGIVSSNGAAFDVVLNTPMYPPVTATAMMPWDTIAEPYKEQELKLNSVMDGQGNPVQLDESTVTWSMCMDSDNTFTLSGYATKFTAPFTGICNCQVSVSHPSSKFSSTLEFTMAVKYVRREIRDLTDDDRNTFLKALNLIYTLPEKEGQKLYGAKYHDANFYSAKHLNGAGVSDCDHWHDGAGLLVHHMAFTLMVEQTLQSINPAISMPYWEYGMDSYLYDPWESSPIFNSDWFGEEPKNAEHTIQDGGMWEGIGVGEGKSFGSDWSMEDTGSINPFSNAYGHLRSPWNNNPTKMISRKNQTYEMTQYGSMPTCTTLKSCFNSDSMADLNDCTNGATHGPVHILIGGSWDGGDFENAEYVRMPSKLLYFKVLWRMGWTRCPTSCDETEECRCAVPQEYIDTYGAYHILESSNILYGNAIHLTNANDDDYLALLRAVEDPGVVGDFYSSAAAFDPIFWPLHGSAERLVGLKRLYLSLETSANFDSTWAFAEYNQYSAAAYLNGRCDWSAVSDPYTDLTLPTCTVGEICYGHGEDDVLDFSGFIGEETYTNAEFFDFLHPWNEELPYVYESYDFDFCGDYGEVFDPYATPAVTGFSPGETFTASMGDASSTTSSGSLGIVTPGMTGGAVGMMPPAPGMTTGTTTGMLPSTPSMMVGPGATTARMSTAPRASSWKSRGSDMKTSVKARAAIRKSEMAQVEKMDIPKELVASGTITSYAKLKEFSDNRRRKL